MKNNLAVLIVGFVSLGGGVSKGGISFGIHGQNDLTCCGGPQDFDSTIRYLIPQIAEPITAAVGANASVIEIVAEKRGTEWTFEENMVSGSDIDSTTSVSELVVLLNWEINADGFSTTAHRAGEAFGDYVKENHADWFGRFGPISVVGHSRGTSAIDGFISSLEESNISIDTAFYLDAVNCCSDRRAKRRDNVIFAQTLRQNISGFMGENIDGTSNLNVGPTIPDNPSDLPHGLVYKAFGDSIDLDRSTDLIYGGRSPERDEFGGVFTHLGGKSHQRPLEGLHTIVGGESDNFNTTTFDGETWPAIALTQDSREKLFNGSNTSVDLVYRDPDSETLSLRVLADMNANLHDGFQSEIVTTALTGGRSEWSQETLNLSGDTYSAPWLHFELSDGNLIRHSTVSVFFDPAEPPMLQAGDANMDLQFEQLDLVQVQIASKYLTGQLATWGEGDWNGAPGGSLGSPPAGDGLFNQLDIVAAQQAAVYLTGPYAGVQANALAAVPEPSSLLLLGVGLLAVTCRRCRVRMVLAHVRTVGPISPDTCTLRTQPIVEAEMKQRVEQGMRIFAKRASFAPHFHQSSRIRS